MNSTQKISRKGLLVLLASMFLASAWPKAAHAQLLLQGPETVVNTNVADNQQYPAAVTGKSGATVVAWESPGVDGDGIGVQAQLYDAAGTITKAEFSVNSTTTNDQRFPAVAVADNGQFVVTWMSFGQDGDGWGIYYSVFSGSGNVLYAETMANQTTAGQQKFPAVAMAADGTFTITWESDGEIIARQFAASGIAAGAEFVVDASNDKPQLQPDIASDVDGNFCITWQAIKTGSTDYDIFGQRFLADGSPRDGRFNVHAASTENQLEPSIAMDTAGFFAISWSSFLQDGDGYGIYVQRYDTTGAAAGSNTKVNETNTDNQLHPDMAAAANGPYIISWTSFLQDGERGGIYVRLMNPDGTFESDETLVNTTTAENQIFPSLGLYVDEGPLTVVWQDGDPASTTSLDGSGYGIIVQRFTIALVEAKAKDITVFLDNSGEATITAADIDDGSTEGATLTLDVSFFDCSNLGPNTVTLTATSADGKTATDMATVTVVDNMAPVVTTTAPDIILDADGAATISIGDIVTNSWDNCEISSLTISQTEFGCEDVGGQQITVTATDPSDNETVVVVDVNVLDNTLPTVVTNDNLTVYLSSSSGSATLTGTDVDFGSYDACGLSYEVSPSEFNCEDVGQQEVTLTVTDPSGNQAMANTFVMVVDTAGPNVLTQDVTVFLDQGGNASTSWTDIDAGTTDICGVTSILSDSLFNCNDLGDNVIQLIATDGSGNVRQRSATVTVVDNLPPTLTLVANYDLILGPDGTATLTAAQVVDNSTDNCEVVSLTLSKEQFSCADVGEQMITVTATDPSGNFSSGMVTVAVIDNEPPTVLGQPTTLELGVDGTVLLTAVAIDAGSSDNCTFALSVSQEAFDCSHLGVNMVALIATDASGNVSQELVEVTTVDVIPPVPVVQNVMVELDEMGSATLSPDDVDNGSSDNCGIVRKAIDVTTFGCDDIGDQDVRLTVYDEAGNEASAIAVVTVVDVLPPTLITQDLSLVLDENGQASTSAGEVDNGSFDNCSEVLQLALAQTLFGCEDLGINTIEFSATDAYGNEATTNVEITVVDDISPTALTMDVVAALDPMTGIATIQPEDIDNGSFDNCQIVERSLDVTSFDCTELGVHPVTLTVKDAAGNADTGVAQVTVVIEEDPIPMANCQDFTLVLDEFGLGWLKPEDIDGGSEDLCGLQSLRIDKTIFYCHDLGENEVVLTVTNIYGNESSCTAIVTVVDELAPRITYLPDAPVVFEAEAGCSADVDLSGIRVFANDNCGATTFTFSPSEGTFEVSDDPYEILVTATDEFGNSSQGTFEILITRRDPSLIIRRAWVRDGLAQIEGDFDDQEIVSLSVDWGDGSATEGLEVSGANFSGAHTYDASGSYQIRVEYQDICGNTYEASRRIRVYLRRSFSSFAPSSSRARAESDELLPDGQELALYPNPFKEYVTIAYRPISSTKVRVGLFSMDGKEIASLYDGPVEGQSVYTWTFDETSLLAPGIYHLHIVGEGVDLSEAVIHHKP